MADPSPQDSAASETDSGKGVRDVASQSSMDDQIRPALTFASPSDPLLALPPPDKLKPNAPLYKRLFHIQHWPHSIRISLTCLCIVSNSLTGNGVYAWPQYGPIVIKRLGLSATEGQTIVVAGICGIYLMAAPLGNLCDRKGPRFSCTVSAALALIGYLSFSFLLERLTPETPYAHIYLSICYFLIGSASVSSYFAGLTTAALSFPAYPTLALSVPLSAFGLSSFVVSSLGRLPFLTQWVVHRDGTVERELIPTAFLRFLGVFVALVNLFSAVFMTVVPSRESDGLGGGDNGFKIGDEEEETEVLMAEEEEGDLSRSVASLTYSTRSRSRDYQDSPEHLLNNSERTPLLIGGAKAVYAAAAEEEARAAKADSIREGFTTPDNNVEAGAGTDPNMTYDQAAMLSAGHIHWTARLLVRDWGFWFFGLILILAIGPAEMTLSSIGSILTSLVLAQDPNAGNTKDFGSVRESSSSSAIDVLGIRTLLAVTSSDDSSSSRPPSLDLLSLRSKHILYLSLSSTLARLLTGIIADYLNPLSVPSIPSVTASLPYMRRRIVKRSILTAAGMGVAMAVYAWTAVGITSEKGLWVLSVGIGSMYGAIFTLAPAITSKHYGPAHFGLSYGMLSYFCAVGAMLYSFLYATISEYLAKEQHASSRHFASSTLNALSKTKIPQLQCVGSDCFRVTYIVAAVSGGVALVGMIGLGRRWGV